MRNGAEGVRSAQFALHCIGDVRLYRGGVDCTPRSKKGRALLAVLAAEQRPLTRVRIIDLLWSDRQEEQARASLRTLLADLRDQFGEDFDKLLTADRERIALAEGVRSDLTDPTLVRPAGELFEGLDHIDPELDDWLRTERERWHGHASAERTTAVHIASPAARRTMPQWALAALLVALIAGTLLVGSSVWRSENGASTSSNSREVDEARVLLSRHSPVAALEARQLLLKVVQQRPNDVQALATLAEATMAASDHPSIGGSLPLATARREARAFSSRAIKLEPREAAGWAALGFSHYATTQSVAPLEKAVGLEPGNARYRFSLGVALEYENRYDEAYLHQLRAIELDPRSADPVIGFIRAAVQLGRRNEMKAIVQAYQGRRPAAADLAYAKGYLAYQLNDDATCVAFLEPIVREGDHRGLSALLYCLSALGETSRAVRLTAHMPSLRSDIIRNDADAVARRAKSMGRDFWLRNFESLAAADILLKAGKHRVLVDSFDASYDSVEDFEREGGRVTREPISILLAMQLAGRTEDARKLRSLLIKQVGDQRAGMALDTWSVFTKAAVALADGEPDQAVDLLEQCFPDCFYGYFQIDISETAYFGRLNRHPRFRELVVRYRQRVNERRKEAGLTPLPIVLAGSSAHA